jgi:hypothetical protein
MIGADGTLLQLHFTGLGSAASLRIVGASLNDNVGRDFATSALRKQIEIVTWHRLCLCRWYGGETAIVFSMK